MHYLFALPSNSTKDIDNIIIDSTKYSIFSTRDSTFFSNILYILVLLI